MEARRDQAGFQCGHLDKTVPKRYLALMSWSSTSPPPIFESEDGFALKMRYAALIAGRPDRVETAGREIFPNEGDEGRALQCRAWRFDPVVIAEMERIERDRAEQGETKQSKHEYAEGRLKEIIDNTQLAIDIRLKAIEQYRDMNQLKTVAGTNIAIDNSITNNKLVVPMRPITEEEREVAALRTEQRQARLMEHARSGRTISVN